MSEYGFLFGQFGLFGLLEGFRTIGRFRTIGSFQNTKTPKANILIIRIKDTTRLSRRLPCPPFGKQGSRAPAGSFPPKICGDFAPLRRFPFAQGHFRVAVCLQPAFGPFNHLIELLCARSPRQSGAAFLFLDPQ